MKRLFTILTSVMLVDISLGCVVLSCGDFIPESFNTICCYSNFDSEIEICQFAGSWDQIDAIYFTSSMSASCSNDQQCMTLAPPKLNQNLNFVVQMQGNLQFPQPPANLIVPDTNKCCNNAVLNVAGQFCENPLTTQPVLTTTQPATTSAQITTQNVQDTAATTSMLSAAQAHTNATQEDSTPGSTTASLQTTIGLASVVSTEGISNTLLYTSTRYNIDNSTWYAAVGLNVSTRMTNTAGQVTEPSSRTDPAGTTDITESDEIVEMRGIAESLSNNSSPGSGLSHFAAAMEQLENATARLAYRSPPGRTHLDLGSVKLLIVKGSVDDFAEKRFVDFRHERSKLEAIAFDAAGTRGHLAVVFCKVDLAEFAPVVAMETFAQIEERKMPLKSLPLLSVSVLDVNGRRKIQARVTFKVNPRKGKGAYGSLDDFGFLLNTKLKTMRPICQYLDTSKRSFEGKGCRLLAAGRDGVTCHCNHTTVFAVLLSVRSYQVPDAVRTISFVTESISIFCLLVTIFVLVALRKKLRSERTMIQINLSLALLFFHLLNLLHDVARGNKAGCEFLAVMLHYFFLATGMWMALEAFTLLVKTSDKALSSFDTKRDARLRVAFGWCVPALIVGFSCAIAFSQQGYLDLAEFHKLDGGRKKGGAVYKKCWVGVEAHTIWYAVVVPMLLVLSFDAVVCVRVTAFVYQMSVRSEGMTSSGEADKQLARSRHTKAALKSIALLIPVLGVPYVFGFLAGVGDLDASVAFMYLNALINGAQGLFVMVVYCAMSREVRKHLRRELRRLFPQSNCVSSMQKSRQSVSHNNSSNKTTSTSVNSTSNASAAKQA